MGAITLAIGDAVLTFVWIFVSSTFGLLTALTITTFGLQGYAWAPVAITAFLIFSFVFVFNMIADALGGASFNPTGNAAIYSAGLGGDSLLSMALRFPAQAAGAVGGVLALMEVMPVKYRDMVAGPSLKVDVHTGAIAEGILTFLITFGVLLIIFKGPRNAVLQALMLALVTVSVVFPGAEYTGPSMNPVNAYGWAYLHKRHHVQEHFYVYWIPPFIGAVLASWVFRIFFPPPEQKQKKA